MREEEDKYIREEKEKQYDKRDRKREGCGIELKERVDGNVTGLIDLSIN